MPTKMFDPKNARRQISTDVSFVNAASTALNSLKEVLPAIVGDTNNEGSDRDNNHQEVDESFREIDDESGSESKVYSVSTAVTLSPLQFTRTTIEISEGVLLTTEDYDWYDELHQLSSRESSSTSSSSSCSSLDAYLDVINDMGTDDLDNSLVTTAGNRRLI